MVFSGIQDVSAFLDAGFFYKQSVLVGLWFGNGLPSHAAMNTPYKSTQPKMTKEFEERKSEKPPGPVTKLIVTLVKLGLFIVAMLYLLMVALPKGLWVEMFTP